MLLLVKSVLRSYLQQVEDDDAAQTDWLALCYKVDRFLFRLYLVVMLAYSITLVSLWGSWSSV